MKTKQEAENSQRTVLLTLSELVENWLWAMSGEKWRVEYFVEFWDFKFKAILEDFFWISPSLDWTRDEKDIIRVLQNFSDEVIFQWKRSKSEKSDDASRAQSFQV